jgi:hypothetical protein
VFLPFCAVLASFSVAANFRTAEQYMMLGKAIVYAGLYRATMGLVFYFGWARSMAEMPPYITQHHDTVLFVTAIAFLIINVVVRRARGAVTFAVVAIPILLMAIQFNNRRLAWVSLGGALVAMYAAMQVGKVKRRITRTLLTMAPLAVLYVVVGWGRGGKLFKPLAAFATVSTVKEPSTLARNAENLGLIATANAYGWVLGSGFGHKYVELSNKYSIAKAFDLWPYVPHNSILGLFAFSGMLGFAGFWMRFPMAVFFHARVSRLAQRPADRTVGIGGIVALVASCNQMYGDMGMFSTTTMYMLALVFGAAMRLPIESGTWGTPSRSAPVARAA